MRAPDSFGPMSPSQIRARDQATKAEYDREVAGGMSQMPQTGFLLKRKPAPNERTQPETEAPAKRTIGVKFL